MRDNTTVLRDGRTISNSFQGWERGVPVDMCEKIAVTWGARAIYANQVIDLLPDRQSWHVPDGGAQGDHLLDRDAVLRRLADWIESRGIPFLRKQARTLYPDECRTVEMDEGNFHIEASPESSCGYLYIRAWELLPQPSPAGQSHRVIEEEIGAPTEESSN